MKTSMLCAVLAAFALPMAQAAKPCEELKSEIAAKLEQKGVKDYELRIVTAAEVGDAKVIGSCENGSKRIVYSRK